MTTRRAWAWGLGCAAALAGCGTDTAEVSLKVVTGLEDDTLRQAPAVTKVRIEARTQSGTVFAAETSPGGAFDLGDVTADEPLTLEVTGTTDAGDVVVRGRSLSGIFLAAVAGELPVFAQRVGAWARPPGGLLRAHVNAPAGVLGERFLATTGGSAAATAEGDADVRLGDFYDLLTLSGAETPALPRSARSMVGRLDALLLIDDQGASWVSTSDGTFTHAAAPSGLAFADVAGGSVVTSPEGTSYVVGATRASGPTKAVLALASNGALSALSLNEARQGAAAAWAPGFGLVVSGGSAAGTTFELLPEKGDHFTSAPSPPDPTEGAAAVVTAEGALMLVGGVAMGMPASTRTLAPGCTSSCAPTELVGANLPAAFTSVRAFALGGGKILAVGHEAEGAHLVRSFLLDLGTVTVTEVPLREPRTGATIVPAPNGTLSLLGGLHPDGTPALHVETFFPP